MKAEDIENFIDAMKKSIQFKQSCTWRNGARFVLFELDKLILKNKEGNKKCQLPTTPLAECKQGTKQENT